MSEFRKVRYIKKEHEKERLDGGANQPKPSKQAEFAPGYLLT